MDVTPEEARKAMAKGEGVEVVDDRASNRYPMPLNASGKDDVEVGRVRQSSVFGMRGLDLFVCGDQLLRGAALNAVLIAEVVMLEDAQSLRRRPQLAYKGKLLRKQFVVWALVLALLAAAYQLLTRALQAAQEL
eukprot:11244044-Prorocentrum_lima.AAC.1